MPDDRTEDATSERDLLRRTRLLSDLSDADLDRLFQAARRIEAAAGTLLIREGDPGDGLYVVLSGELEVFHEEDGEVVRLAIEGPGSFVGEMALLGQAPRTASVRALVPSDLLFVGPDHFHELIASSPTASLTILRTVAARLRSTERTLVERERLANLGTLTAGLAHELNNPSAALPRTAEHLEKLIGEWGRSVAEISCLELDEPARRLIRELEQAFEAPPPEGDPLPSATAELAIEGWLEEAGFEGGWELAPHLAAREWTPEKLATLAETFGDSSAPVIRWLATGLAIRALADEVRRAAQTISSVVAAVRMYSHQARTVSEGPVDIAESLGHALTLLRHKLKGGVEVRMELPPDLPSLEGKASELGQLWTILIDNAVDAMEGKGTLQISAAADGGELSVAFVDSGPGVPPAIANRVFDPFVTTKPPGKGTGLGLAIARRIVQDHRGTIQSDSRPGRTEFQVRLPLGS